MQLRDALDKEVENMPQISVIVPVFKVEKYLKQCVDSILNQTFPDLELLLVDDGTPDLCGAYCDTDALEDDRIVVIHHENQGQGAARNRAVGVSSGKWVNFVDSDDLIHPQMLEILHRAAIDTDTKLSMCVYCEAVQTPKAFFEAVPETLQTQLVSIDENKLLEYLNDGNTGFYWVVWGKLLDKSILIAQPIPEGHFYEDNAVASRWLHMAGLAAIVDRPLYFYRINDTGTTKGINPNKYVDILWSLREQIEYYKIFRYKNLLRRLVSVYFEKAIGYYWMKVYQHEDRKRAKMIRKNAVVTYLSCFNFIQSNKLLCAMKLLRMFFPNKAEQKEKMYK